MKRFLLFIFTGFLLFNFSTSPLMASKTKPFRTAEDADAYLTEHYNLGCEYYNAEKWSKASTEFEKVIYFFPYSEEAAMASYYLAVCYFEMQELDFANEEFSNYIKASHHPEFFEDAVYFKYCIAEYFKAGKKRRPYKMRYLPKWISGQDSALAIYDEVIAALPNHELTIQAMQSKAELLNMMGEYRECIETYMMIIRRFPKDESVPTCYLKIADTYYQLARIELQNPDILALAELNARKFRDQFPRDESIEQVEETVCAIKELYAKGLCDLGLFYQRMGKPEAAAIYFQSSIEEFPETKVACFCRSRLKCLGYGSQVCDDQPLCDGPEECEQSVEEPDAYPSPNEYWDLPFQIESVDGLPDGQEGQQSAFWEDDTFSPGYPTEYPVFDQNQEYEYRDSKTDDFSERNDVPETAYSPDMSHAAMPYFSEMNDDQEAYPFAETSEDVLRYYDDPDLSNPPSASNWSQGSASTYEETPEMIYSSEASVYSQSSLSYESQEVSRGYNNDPEGGYSPGASFSTEENDPYPSFSYDSLKYYDDLMIVDSPESSDSSQGSDSTYEDPSEMIYSPDMNAEQQPSFSSENKGASTKYDYDPERGHSSGASFSNQGNDPSFSYDSLKYYDDLLMVDSPELSGSSQESDSYQQYSSHDRVYPTQSSHFPDTTSSVDPSPTAQDNTQYYLHYSELKRRKRHVAPQE